MRLPLILLAAAALACTLSRGDPNPTSRVVTATLSAHVQAASPTATWAAAIPTTRTSTAAALLSPAAGASITPSDTRTPEPVPGATATPGPTLPPSPVPPTRTPPGPTAAPALDDGSGGIVPGTGNSSVFALVEGVDELPETLYYLSPDASGVPQVWRLRVGLSYPDQLSFSPAGVAAFAVSPDGTLAYITPTGQMVVGGVPFALPDSPDGVSPAVTALAWSPGGDWLAYTVYTPLPADSPRAEPVIDGLYLRSREGTGAFLQPNDYAVPGWRVYTGPIDWRPGGSELLVGSTAGQSVQFSRIDITTNIVTPVWDTVVGRSGTFPSATWSVNNNAIIGTGGGTILRIEPDGGSTSTLLAANLDLWPENAQQFADGSVMFVGVGGDDARRLYLLRPGEALPSAITDTLITGGAVDYLWDSQGQQTLLAVYDVPGASAGSARLLTVDGFFDLTTVTGPVGAPVWGPAFQVGDLARIQTTRGETLNIRDQPSTSAAVLFEMVAGSRVVIMGGPRASDGFRWWRVRTPDGISGWAAESVIDERGLRLRTLLPTD